MSRRHLFLVGLPGSGKSTVGPVLATAVGLPFVDLDAVIIRRMGMPVDRIFGEFGEAKFRELEREATAAQLRAAAGVVAPGGGWAAQPGNLEHARARSRFCYLKVQPEIALERAGQGAVRPLLRGGEGLARMMALLSERASYYQQADLTVENDGGDPARTAAEIAEWFLRNDAP